jgi:hypothetical protein
MLYTYSIIYLLKAFSGRHPLRQLLANVQMFLFSTCIFQTFQVHQSQERLGRNVGIADHKGDSLTFLVFDSVTTQVVPRSEVRSGLNSSTPNIHTLLAPDGSTPASRKTIKSHTDAIDIEIPTPSLKLPRFSPNELLGKCFLRTLDDGKSYCATVVLKIHNHDAENHTRISV